MILLVLLVRLVLLASECNEAVERISIRRELESMYSVPTSYR